MIGEVDKNGRPVIRTQEDLEYLVLKIWKDANTTWNGGKFANLMADFFNLMGFKTEACQERLARAFEIYLASSNLKSEDCLRGAVKDIWENKESKYMLGITIEFTLGKIE